MGSKLCIEFSSNIIRFAKGRFKNKFILESFFSLNLKSESLVDSSYSEEVLGQMIKNELNTRKVKNKEVDFIISAMPNMLVREIIIPNTSKKDTYFIVNQEVKKHFPINIDNYVIDFKLVDKFKEDKVTKQRVVCIAVPKFLIERIIGIANAADLTINKIDVEANVLSKLLYQYQQQIERIAEEGSVICSIQDTYITMVLAKKGIIQMSKTTSYTSVDIIPEEIVLEEVASSKEITEEKNNSSVNFSEVSEAIADHIVRYINFCTSKQREAIKTVYIVGEIGEKFNIKSSIESRIEVVARNIDKLKLLIKNEEFKRENIADYKVVFGGLIK